MSTPKTFKRILALVLSLVLIAGMLPLSAAAVGEAFFAYTDEELQNVINMSARYTPGSATTVYAAVDASEYDDNGIHDVTVEAGNWVGEGDSEWVPLQDQSFVSMTEEDNPRDGKRVFHIDIGAAATGNFSVMLKWVRNDDSEGFFDVRFEAYYQGPVLREFTYDDHDQDLHANIVPDQLPQVNETNWDYGFIFPETGHRLQPGTEIFTLVYVDEAAGTVSGPLPVGNITKTGNVNVTKITDRFNPANFKHPDGTQVAKEEGLILEFNATSATDFGDEFSVTFTLAQAVSGVPNTLTYNGRFSTDRRFNRFWTGLSGSRSDVLLGNNYYYNPSAATGAN